MVERVELGEEGYFHQLVCSGCSRVTTTPINRVYLDRPVTLTKDEQVWAARRERALVPQVCPRCKAEPAAPGRWMGQKCLDAANAYAKAYYRRKKQERARCR
jgi:hypothetical protein